MTTVKTTDVRPRATIELKLSIIVVNYKSWGYLQSAIDALQVDFPHDWEIVVVDNESIATDFEEFRSKNTWVNLVANPVNSGFGPGCMIGVAESKGERLLFMNPDVVATVAQIKALLQIKKENPNIALLSPKQIGTDGKPQKVFDEFPDLINQSKTLKAIRRLVFPSRSPDPRIEHSELVWCDWITGSCMLIDRRDFDAIGGWSPDYWMYVEDADLCRRAQNAGLRVAYTPEVEVIHVHGGSSRINVATKSLTKLEVIISKHVYASKHMQGLARPLTHALIALLRAPSLLIATALDWLSFRQIAALNVRSNIALGLLRYYGGVFSSGSWLSPRAKANQV